MADDKDQNQKDMNAKPENEPKTPQMMDAPKSVPIQEAVIDAPQPTYGKGKTQLKIFSGPHQGSEFDLNEASYIIGKNEEADIIFADDALSDNHAELIVKNKEFILKVSKSPLYLSGEKIDAGEHVIPPYHMITMGNTNLAFGFSEDKWPVIPMPGFVQEEIIPEEKSEEAFKSESAPEQTIPDEDQGGRFAWLHKMRDKEYWRERKQWATQKSKENPILASIIGIGGVVLLLSILVLLYLSIFNGAGSSSIEDIQKSYMQQATKIIEQQGLTGSVVANGPVDGYIILRGYVPTISDKERLLNAFANVNIAVDPEIHISAQIEESARIVLAALGYDLRIQMEENGVLMVQGVVDSEGPVMNLLVKLKKDVAGILRIDDRIIAMDTLGRNLSQIANEYGLLSLVSFDILGRQINVTGNVFEHLTSQYNKMISAIKTLVMNEFQVLSKIDILKDDTLTEKDEEVEEIIDDISESISGVWLGRNPYIVYKDESRFYEDELLPDGAKIIKITSKEIIITKDGVTFGYNYRKHAQWIVETVG